MKSKENKYNYDPLFVSHQKYVVSGWVLDMIMRTVDMDLWANPQSINAATTRRIIFSLLAGEDIQLASKK